MAQTKVLAIPLTTLASTALTNNYQALNASGLPEACFMIRIVNGGTTPLLLSYDGINDNDQVLNGSVAELQSQTNSQPNPQESLFGKGQIVYVKGTAGASGTISLAGYYVLPTRIK